MLRYPIQDVAEVAVLEILLHFLSFGLVVHCCTVLIMLEVPLIRLQCGVNSYDWGKVGSDSAAAKFAAATPSDNFSIQSDKPYAEVRDDCLLMQEW